MALPSWTDYNTDCGDMPLSWLQMLASTIRGYTAQEGADTSYKINTITASDNCSSLTGLVTCAISHIEAERLLVENTFALDDCGYLLMKVFSNGDNDWVDYGECGEMPLSFLQMLAKTIVLYGDSYFINAVIDGGQCSNVEALLTCVTNQIESERLLVQNLFAVDDCGNTLIKFFSNGSTLIDYHTECNDMPQSFYQLLARCIVTYEGHTYLNVAYVVGSCDNLSDFWTCNNGHIPPERALVENVFAIDECNNLVLKIYYSTGRRGGVE